ncbi:thiamine diphosphokinase [Sphingobacterium sp. LRF_L2]|uniref:thiamine diphosphokinase n=1 Tax=Sphingobacterium sp. LRF_L2 TaxID=3369421 RepID=UPI003F5F6E8D
MSSHHIVRENQEPALIIASIDALSSEYLGQLLEWSPTIIANEYTLDFFLADNIKVDVVFTEKKECYSQEQIKVFQLTQSFLVESLTYLVSNNYAAVHIISDEIVVDEILPFCDKMNISLFSADRRYVFVQQHYEKWKVAHSLIYVHEDKLKSFVGLRKLSDNVFETVQDGFFYIDFNTDAYVLIGEEI